MNSIEISSLVACLLMLAALGGAALRRALPRHHLNDHTKDVVRLSASLIATIVGLVLGLLISSAKANFDTQRDGMRQLTSSAIMLEHTLAQYGPEATPVRVALRTATARFIGELWGHSASPALDGPFVPSAAGIDMYRHVVALAPTTDEQRFYKGQATSIATTLMQQRLALYEEAGSRMPSLLVIVLVSWLCVLFASFSLFSPLNPTAIAVIAVIAICAAGAFFLIFEMYEPFNGVMKIDPRPMINALAPLSP